MYQWETRKLPKISLPISEPKPEWFEIEGNNEIFIDMVINLTDELSLS